MIGASAYRSPLHDLPAVANNLIRLKELLTDPAIWGLREEHCRLIGQDELSGQGARATALDAIYDAAHAATDLLLVYYAGHGLLDRDDAFYLGLPDSDELRPHTALEYAAIRQVLSSTSRPRNTVVILDCCFAARAIPHGMASNLALAGRQVAREGTYLLAAAAETKPALAEPGQRYTAFTAELIDALALGIPSAGAFLDLETLFEHLSSVLSAKGSPVPQAFNRNHGARIVLGRNRGFTGPEWSMSPALAGFLRGQVRAADVFPYRLAGARSFGLTTVYIRQNVTSPSAVAANSGRERSEAGASSRSRPASDDVRPSFAGADIPAEPQDDGQQGTSRLLLPRLTERVLGTSAEILGTNAHLVIVGGPGQGKSTLTLTLAAELARSWIAGSGGTPIPSLRWIAIRVRASALADSELPFETALIRAAALDLGIALDRPVPSDLMDQVPDDAGWLVLVDGVDEIADPPTRRGLLTQLAARCADIDARLRLLITTRPLPAGDLAILSRAGAQSYDLAPFDDDQLEAFATTWFDQGDSADQSADFLGRARTSALRELLRNPLLATISAVTYEQRPGQPLPGSRYLLLEQYLTYAARARSHEVAGLHRRVQAESAVLGGETAASAAFLFGHLGEVVDHLAEQAVAGRTDLLDAALEWLARGGGPAARLALPDWRDLVVATLAATGVLVHASDGLGFVHQTFAEHIASRAAARRLPPALDPDDPVWRALLHRALRRHTPSIDILVSHTYHHESADDLLSWFEPGEGFSQLIVGRLLLEGGPASPVHASRFLDRLRRDVTFDLFSMDHYLMTGSKPLITLDCIEIVAQLGGLATRSFFEDLGSSSSTGFDARIAMFTALCRAGYPLPIAGLRSLIEGIHTDGERVLRLASALGDEYRAELRGALRHTAADEYAAVSTRRAAVRLMAADADEEAQALRSLVSQTWIRSSQYSYLAGELGALSPECAEEAAGLLGRQLEVFARPDSTSQPDFRDRRSALVALGRLGRGYVHRAADEMRSLLHSRRADGTPLLAAGERLALAKDLSGLGPEYGTEAAAILFDVIEILDASQVGLIQADLLQLDGRPIPEVIDLLHSIGRTGPEWDRLSAAQLLAQMGGHHAAESAAIAVAAARDGPPDAPAEQRLVNHTAVRAAEFLAGLGPDYHHQAAEILRAESSSWTARSASSRDHLALATIFASMGAHYTPETVLHLRAVLDGEYIDEDLFCAAILIADVGPEYVTLAASTFRLIIAHRTRGVSKHYNRSRNYEIEPFKSALSAARALSDLGPQYAAEARAVLRDLKEHEVLPWGYKDTDYDSAG